MAVIEFLSPWQSLLCTDRVHVGSRTPCSGHPGSLQAHLVALQGGSRAGGSADRRLRPSAFCSSMLMQGVSLAAGHATVAWPTLVQQSGASYGRGASGARAAGSQAEHLS